MILTIILLLSVLWLLGYAPLSGISIPDYTLFTILNHQVTLWETLIFLVVGWAIGILPQPLQTIASVLLLLWVLSILGFLAIPGLANILVIVIIIGLVASLLI
jgi:hypothetical protein